MDIIDFHAHAFPDSLADRAIRALENEIDGVWKAFLDGRVSSLIDSMDAAGISTAVVCPIATKPDQFDGILAWCLGIRSERIVPLGSIHPSAPDVAEQVRRVADQGLIGVKLHPMYQQFTVDEPRLDPLYGALADAGLLTVLHCGYDIAFPGSEQAHPAKTAAVIDRHPGLRLLATHMGGWKHWPAVREHLLGRDVWMETSFSCGWLPDEELVSLIRSHGVGRVLFGTDSPWADQSAEVSHVRSLGLTDEERRAVLFENAAGLLAEWGEGSA